MCPVAVSDPGLVDGQDPVAEDRRLRVLFDSLPALIGYWDRELRNVIANDAYVEWFGLTPAQLVGMHISEVVGETVYEQNLPYMEAALAGTEQTFQRTLVDVSGAIRHTQVSYSPDLVDAEVLGLFVMITDVTPRVEAQRQMDEAQRLAELGSWTLIPSTGELTWSRQLFELVGQDPATFTPVVDALVPQLHPDDRERVLTTSAQAQEAGTGYELRYRLVRPDGAVREMLSRVRGEVDDRGTVARLTGTMQDVTSQSELSRAMARVNDELQQVNQLNADVLGVVGHDLRQPLALVLGHLEVLGTFWDDSSEAARLDRVDKALAAAKRLSALVDDILAMASFDTGSIATRPIAVRLEDVVTDALAGVQEGTAVEVRVEGDPVALVDPFHLRQMVANLVSNALRYGALPVVVTVAERDGSVFLEVLDHGAGVPEDFVPHLFERFTRASSAAAGQPAGSGFGLYIVGRLAEANGAGLTYAPATPSGSRFRLDLPSSAG
jgi:PAS domain S-box-containing protein